MFDGPVINGKLSLGGFSIQTLTSGHCSARALSARCSKCGRTDSVSLAPVADGTGTKISCEICGASLVASSHFFEPEL